MPRAASLAEHLLHDFDSDLAGGVLLKPGEVGSFEVFFDERRIFSKLDRDRFPDENEVETLVGGLLVPA